MKRPISSIDSSSTSKRIRETVDSQPTGQVIQIAPSLISRLPEQLQEEMLQWLTPRDLLRLGQTSKWYFKRCDAVYLVPRPREKFQCFSLCARSGEVALSQLWEKYARPGINLLGQKVPTAATDDVFKTFQTVVVPRAARCVHTLWIQASELLVHLNSLPLKAGFTRLRINLDSSVDWQAVCNDRWGVAWRLKELDSAELIFKIDQVYEQGSIDVHRLGSALKALSFHSAKQIDALKGNLDSVRTLCLDTDFFRDCDVAAVIAWVKERLPKLNELSVMNCDEGVRELLDAMPGIHTLSLDHESVESRDIEGALRSGVGHLYLGAQAGNAEGWKNLISPTYQVDQLETLELTYLKFPNLPSLRDLLSRLPALRQLKLEHIELKEPDEQGWIGFIQELAARPGLDLKLVGDGRS